MQDGEVQRHIALLVDEGAQRALQAGGDAQAFRGFGAAALDAGGGQQGKMVLAAEVVHDFQGLAVLPGNRLVGPAPQKAAFAVAGGADQAHGGHDFVQRAFEHQGGAVQVPAVGGRALQAELARRNIKRLVIVGAQTEVCVESTARQAVSQGYDVLLAADAHATADRETLSAEQIVAFTNEVLHGHRAGDHVVRVLPASEISFS